VCICCHELLSCFTAVDEAQGLGDFLQAMTHFSRNSSRQQPVCLWRKGEDEAQGLGDFLQAMTPFSRNSSRQQPVCLWRKGELTWKNPPRMHPALMRPIW